MEMYLNDSTGIIDLRDFHGNKIKEGDLLSWDFYCEHYQKNNNVKDWMKKLFM